MKSSFSRSKEIKYCRSRLRKTTNRFKVEVFVRVKSTFIRSSFAFLKNLIVSFTIFEFFAFASLSKLDAHRKFKQHVLLPIFKSGWSIGTLFLSPIFFGAFVSLSACRKSSKQRKTFVFPKGLHLFESNRILFIASLCELLRRIRSLSVFAAELFEKRSEFFFSRKRLPNDQFVESGTIYFSTFVDVFCFIEILFFSVTFINESWD